MMPEFYRRKTGLFKPIIFRFQTPVSPEACVFNLEQRQKNAPNVFMVSATKRDPFTYEFTIIRNLNGSSQATGKLQLQADNSTLVSGRAQNLYGCLDYVTFAIPFMIIGYFGISSILHAVDGNLAPLAMWTLATLVSVVVFFVHNRRYEYLVDELEKLVTVSNVDRRM
jgi:hypothetical protein